MAGKRITRAELTTRIETVVTLVLSGLRYAEMWRFVTDKTDWLVSQRTFDRYLSKANASIEASAEKDADRQLSRTRLRLTDLYKKAINIQDYKTALAILRESNKLYGLYPPEKHEHTGADGGPIEYADAKERLLGLLAKGAALNADTDSPGDNDG